MRRIAALALAFAAVLASLACFMPDDSPRISIEFGAVPELEGADVLVDGQPVGKLEVTGQATRISFPVVPGQHEVCVRSPRFDCQPVKVLTEMKGQKIRLIAMIGEVYSANGSGKPTITFQQ